MPSASSTPSSPAKRPLGVVLFSGGRGSGALTRELVRRGGLSLTIAINGYDDGASTGEVRRFLGDALGPSDFRKNASRVATELGTCPAALIELLDGRFPAVIEPDAALRHLAALAQDRAFDPRVGEWLRAFLREYEEAGRFFAFGDCSFGNLVFAGAFLQAGRDFNRAVDDYCGLLGVPAGMVENVTDGGNAHLVAIDEGGRLLRHEADIVDARAQNRIRGLFLIGRPLTDEDVARLERQGPDQAARSLASLQAELRLNPRLAERIAASDVIIYAPGTQHSSLFPSYMTTGLGDAIAANLHATKLLVTNIETDAEITGSTAVDLIDRALYYLTVKGTRPIPTPCLITHYLMNEPGKTDTRPYVPLGAVETIEDPRLVRIGNYEDGVTGRHDATRILGPFIDALLAEPRRMRMAVLLHDAGSLNKITQTLIELVRGGIEQLPLDISVFCLVPTAVDPSIAARFPFAVRQVDDARAFTAAVDAGSFDFVGLFESSGMYRGEDLVALAAHAASNRFDAMWGSRRLSMRDVHEAYRIIYRRNMALGAVSYAGSHVLSFAYLGLYGRYVSDTLSAVRIVRAEDALAVGIELTHKLANQYLLSRLLRRRADILEVPVRFLPLSPEKVKRTSALDGLSALITILGRRFASASAVNPPAARGTVPSADPLAPPR